MEDRYFTKYTMTSNLILFLLVLSFEDHFRFFMLFLNKYLNINRNKFFDKFFLLAIFLKGFCLIAQEGFGFLFFKDAG